MWPNEKDGQTDPRGIFKHKMDSSSNMSQSESEGLVRMSKSDLTRV